MNALVTLNGGEAVTMTSLELVEFINSQRGEGEAILAHSDFLKKVPQVLGDGVAGNFSSYYTASNGKQNPCYCFQKREACLMAMSYSYDLQAKVFDRMTALESKQAFQIPSTLSGALMLAAKQAEQIEQQSALIEAAKPKVEFHDTVCEAINSQSVEEVAKVLGTGRNRMFNWLREKGLFKNDNLPYQDYIDRQYFRVIERAYKDKKGEAHTYTRTLVTGKGLAYIQNQFSTGSAA